MIRFTADTKKVILSSTRRVYKTEGFISGTRKIVSIDAFISRVAEGIFKENIVLPDGCSIVQTEDGLYTLYLYRKDDGRLSEEDIVFYKLISAHPDEAGLDRRLKDYLAERETISFILRDTDETASDEDLTRLYLVSSSDGIINFPYLNKTQREIVETEDANMLVQGIAGSGKTNVCVEKIVYCACRNYENNIAMTYIEEMLHFYETMKSFQLHLKQGVIDPDAICFIKETSQIYVQGTFIGICKERFETLELKMLELETKLNKLSELSDNLEYFQSLKDRMDALEELIKTLPKWEFTNS